MSHWCLRDVNYDEIQFLDHNRLNFKESLPSSSSLSSSSSCRCSLREAMLDRKSHTKIPTLIANWPLEILRLNDVICPEECDRCFDSPDQLWSFIFKGLVSMSLNNCRLLRLDLTGFVPSSSLLYTVFQLIPFLSLKSSERKPMKIYNLVVNSEPFTNLGPEVVRDENLLQNIDKFLNRVLSHRVFTRERSIVLPHRRGYSILLSLSLKVMLAISVLGGCLSIVFDFLPISPRTLTFISYLVSICVSSLSHVYVTAQTISYTYDDINGSDINPVINKILPLQIAFRLSKDQICGVGVEDVDIESIDTVLDHFVLLSSSLQQPRQQQQQQQQQRQQQQRHRERQGQRKQHQERQQQQQVRNLQIKHQQQLEEHRQPPNQHFSKLHMAYSHIRLEYADHLRSLTTLFSSFAHLLRLDLSGTSLHSRLPLLLAALHTPLQYLSLADCACDVSDIDALASSSNAASLHDLDLSNIYAVGCRACAQRRCRSSGRRSSGRRSSGRRSVSTSDPVHRAWSWLSNGRPSDDTLGCQSPTSPGRTRLFSGPHQLKSWRSTVASEEAFGTMSSESGTVETETPWISRIKGRGTFENGDSLPVSETSSGSGTIGDVTPMACQYGHSVFTESSSLSTLWSSTSSLAQELVWGIPSDDTGNFTETGNSTPVAVEFLASPLHDFEIPIDEERNFMVENNSAPIFENFRSSQLQVLGTCDAPWNFTSMGFSTPVDITEFTQVHEEDRVLFQHIVENLHRFPALNLLDISTGSYAFRVPAGLLTSLIVSIASIPTLQRIALEGIPLWDDDILNFLESALHTCEALQSIALTISPDAPRLKFTDKIEFWKRIGRCKGERRVRMSIEGFDEHGASNWSPDNSEDTGLLEL